MPCPGSNSGATAFREEVERIGVIATDTGSTPYNNVQRLPDFPLRALRSPFSEGTLLIDRLGFVSSMSAAANDGLVPPSRVQGDGTGPVSDPSHTLRVLDGFLLGFRIGCTAVAPGRAYLASPSEALDGELLLFPQVTFTRLFDLPEEVNGESASGPRLILYRRHDAHSGTGRVLLG